MTIAINLVLCGFIILTCWFLFYTFLLKTIIRTQVVAIKNMAQRIRELEKQHAEETT